MDKSEHELKSTEVVQRGGAPPQLRRSVFWTVIANSSGAISQLAILAVITRFLEPPAVGRYFYAQALTTPVLMLASLQLNAIQVTDQADRHPFAHYLVLRKVMLLAGLLCVSAVVSWAGTSADVVIVVLVYATQAVNASREIHLAALQKLEQFDVVARSQFFQGVLAFGLVLVAADRTRSLETVLIALIGARYAVWILHDRAYVYRTLAPARFTLRSLTEWLQLLRLAREALPLGVVKLLVALNSSLPRLFLHAFWGSTSVAHFGVIAYVLEPGKFAVAAVAQSIAPRLSRYHYRRDPMFFSVVFVTCLSVLACGLTLAAACLTFGGRLFSLAFGEAYGTHSLAMGVMLSAGAISFGGSIIGTAITAARVFQPQVWVVACSTVATLLACAAAVPRYGLSGAVGAVTAAAAVSAGGYLIVFVAKVAPFLSTVGGEREDSACA